MHRTPGRRVVVSLVIIKSDLVKLCIDLYDGPFEGFEDRVVSIRKKMHSSSDWIAANEHMYQKAVSNLNASLDLYERDFEEANWCVNVADGCLEEAMRIDAEERRKGVPKGVDRTPGPINPANVEYRINLEGWLRLFGEGVLLPGVRMASWEAFPEDKNDEANWGWADGEIPVLNKILKKKDGQLVDDTDYCYDCTWGEGEYGPLEERCETCQAKVGTDLTGTHVFRFMGKGKKELGEWITDPEGTEHLFAVFSLENDPGRLSVRQEKREYQPDFDIDLERWLRAYGEEEHPAKMMCPIEDLKEKRQLNKKLKDLDGTRVGETYTWTYHGLKTYRREGKKDLFGCVPD